MPHDDRRSGRSLALAIFVETVVTPEKPIRRRKLIPLAAGERRAHCVQAVALFNAQSFWEAHEALEAVWRSIDDVGEARVVQGLIQAAAALLHRERGNRHGVDVVGKAALEKLAGPQHPAVEFETEKFRAELEQALAQSGPVPRLNLRMP